MLGEVRSQPTAKLNHNNIHEEAAATAVTLEPGKATPEPAALVATDTDGAKTSNRNVASRKQLHE